MQKNPMDGRSRKTVITGSRIGAIGATCLLTGKGCSRAITTPTFQKSSQVMISKGLALH